MGGYRATKATAGDRLDVPLRTLQSTERRSKSVCSNKGQAR